MAHYIDKDALVAEIKKTIDEIYKGQPFDSLSKEKQVALWYIKSIMSSINTLEVKEVDLKKIPIWVKELPMERPFDEGWFIGMDDCLHRKGYKIKICDLWNLPKEPFNSRDFETI